MNQTSFPFIDNYSNTMMKRMMEVMAVRKRMAKSRKVTKHNNKMRKRRTKVTPIVGKRAARATTRNHWKMRKRQ